MDILKQGTGKTMSDIILFCHRIDVLHEIALRLSELSVLPPF